VFAARADKGNDIAAVIEIAAGKVAVALTPAANNVCSQVRRDRDVRFKSASPSNSNSEFEFEFEFSAGAKRFEFI
jgi:hypothetical protein